MRKEACCENGQFQELLSIHDPVIYMVTNCLYIFYQTSFDFVKVVCHFCRQAGRVDAGL